MLGCWVVYIFQVTTPPPPGSTKHSSIRVISLDMQGWYFYSVYMYIGNIKVGLHPSSAHGPTPFASNI